jgi:hypothetical protein
MDNEPKLEDLPNNWWQQLSTCQVLADWFSHHLVGLFFSVQIDGHHQQCVYTGLILNYENNLLWATAGHVIDQISNLLFDSRINIWAMRWLDGCEIPGAESIPVHNRNFDMFSATKFGIDFGVVRIIGLDAENMLRNEHIQLITEQAWKNPHLGKPEGYYVVGYPEEWIQYKEKQLSDNQVFNSFRANVACLPVRQIEYMGGSYPNKEFWSDPEAFYGQLVPFDDGSQYQPTSVKGMSGGPLFSIERDPSDRIRYRFIGIQRSEDKENRFIRVEKVQKIFGLMDSQ